MTKSQFKKLIDRYLKGKTNPQDTNLIDDFYSRVIGEPILPEVWNEIEKSKLETRMYDKITSKTHQPRRPPHFLYLLGAVATIVLLISGYLFYQEPSSTFPKQLAPPEKSTIVAGNDQRSVLLSDGSYVLLYPGASLTFPTRFDGDIRKVTLDGEAWFDVYENPHQPFQVISHEITTTVLGTSFTISSHPENSRIEVKVTSGKVKVSARDQEIAILEMDDHLEYEAGSFRIIQNHESTEAPGEPQRPDNWKLADVTMAEAAEFLEKRWNKIFIFEDERLKQCLLYASFNADDPLDEVMMIICGVTSTDYRMEEDKIKIFGPGCQPEE